LRVGALLFYIEKALRLAWEDFVLEPWFTNFGGKEMIYYIVIPHVQKRLFWLKLSGKYELRSWLNDTSSVLERIWIYCIIGIYTLCCKDSALFLQILGYLSLFVLL
jgi:hypothetical protein